MKILKDFGDKFSKKDVDKMAEAMEGHTVTMPLSPNFLPKLIPDEMMQKIMDDLGITALNPEHYKIIPVPANEDDTP